MKHVVIFFLVVIAPSVVGAIPTTTTYQGVLVDVDGNPISGSHDLVFSLYSSQDHDAAALWSESHASIVVQDGVFQVVLGRQTDLSSSLLDADELWIGVTIDGGEEVAPRAPLVAVPWAIRAAVADSVSTGMSSGGGDGHSLDASDGYPLDAVYVNEDGDVGIGTLAPENRLHIVGNRASFRGIRVGYSDTLANYVEFRMAGTNTAKIHQHSGEGIATIDIDPEPADGSNGAYVRFFRNTNTTGVKEVRFVTGDGNANTGALIRPDGGDSWFQRYGGNFGIGTTSPQGLLDVHSGGDPLSALFVKSNSGIANQGGIIHHQGSTYGWQEVAQGTGSSTSGLLKFNYVDRGNPSSILTEGIMSLRANGLTYLKALRVTGDADGVSTALDVVGRTRTGVLEITGGSDIAEPFEMTDNDLPSGSAVVIDRNHPGKLSISTQPYDRAVAGIISGAGGVNPGMSLSQEGVLDEGKHVALAGRVYARACVENGAIEPGDRLTTSSRPGLLMKATDPDRTPGSVVGKSMSALEAGEGMVLVLIQAQ